MQEFWKSPIKEIQEEKKHVLVAVTKDMRTDPGAGAHFGHRVSQGQGL